MSANWDVGGRATRDKRAELYLPWGRYTIQYLLVWPGMKENTMDRDTFDATMRTFKSRIPFRPFTVAMVNGDRLEVDHPDALAIRDGVALFARSGGVPVVFDYEGVSQVIGDLADRSSS